MTDKERSRSRFLHSPRALAKTRRNSSRKPARIGIYAGTFDPVHSGHIAFALQALKTGRLDAVYFLPERQPRGKEGVEHFAHRVAMLNRAARPHPQFGVLEFVDTQFSVQRTLPQLQRRFKTCELVFLFGSDVATSLIEWPKSESLLASSELVIGVRGSDDLARVRQQITGWPVQPKQLHVFTSYAPDISSGTIREALRRRAYVRGLLASVQHYSDRHWLYVSIA